MVFILFAIILTGLFSPSEANAATRANQPKYTFYDGNLKYEIIKPATKSKAGQVSLTGARDKSIDSLTIPETVRDLSYSYTVTKIADSAFSNFSNLQSVTISSSVSSLGNYAFSGCDRLQSVRQACLLRLQIP